MTLSSLSTADITLEPWWKCAGFLWHPFEQLDAAQEEHLQEYFIELPRFWEVSGRAHTVLYAPLGGGKTAARRMLEQQCLAGEIEGTLVVVCDDFARVLRQAGGNPRDVTAEMLTEEIMRQAADIVFEHWMENIESFQETTAFHRRWVACFLDDWEARCDETLHKLGLEEAVSVQQVQEEPPEVLMSRVEEDYWPWVRMLSTLSLLRREPPEERTASEWLERLGGVARQLGFETVYVLFDRVDGLSQTASPEGCAALVQPLLDSTVLLSVPDVYFKLFLPLETRSSLKQMAGIRSQRVVEVEAKWDKKGLGALLKERLHTASEGNVETLEAISEKEEEISKIDDDLIHYARTPRHLIRLGHYARTPRHLIRLGQKLFAEHEQLSSESPLLTKRDLDAALEQERKEEQLSQAGESSHRREQRYRWVWAIAAVLAVIVIGIFLFGAEQYIWVVSIGGVILLLVQCILYKLIGQERKIQRADKIPVAKFLGILVLEIFLPFLFASKLPSLWPYISVEGRQVSECPVIVASRHPCWGVWGGEAEIRVIAKDFTRTVTTTVEFKVGEVEWLESPVIQWTAEEGGKTKSLPVRFSAPGEVEYYIIVECNSNPAEVAGGRFRVARAPAPLISGIGTVIGALLSLFNQIADLFKRIQDFLSKVRR